MMDSPTDLQRRKSELRAAAGASRRGQQNPAGTSRRIFEQLIALPEFARSGVILSYVSFRSEVRTGDFLVRAMSDGKSVAVPYCVGDRLELFRLESPDELAPATLGILEPKLELRGRADRHLEAGQLDLLVVPGVAFDRRCGRLGYGRGYYDRLLRQVRPDAAAVAVAFQCQILPEVPMLPYDVRVDMVITEEAIYRRSEPRYEG